MKDGARITGGDAVLHETRVENAADEKQRNRIHKILSILRTQNELIIDEIGGVMDQRINANLHAASESLAAAIGELSKI